MHSHGHSKKYDYSQEYENELARLPNNILCLVDKVTGAIRMRQVDKVTGGKSYTPLSRFLHGRAQRTTGR
jgi:hypothetical protein